MTDPEAAPDRSALEAAPVRRRRARVHLLGRGPDARDPRRTDPRAVRRHQPRDVHRDHRHRARRHRGRRMGRRQGRRPHRSAPAAGPGDRRGRRARVPHRSDHPRPRQPVVRGRGRLRARVGLRGLLPPRGRAERGHADGREAAAPRPLHHRWHRRAAQRDLDHRRARRHVRDRVRARGDDTHAHHHRRHRRGAGRAGRGADRRAVAPGHRSLDGDRRCWPAVRSRSVRWRPSRARSRARTTASGSSTTCSATAAASSGSTTCATATSTSPTRPISSSTTRARSPTPSTSRSRGDRRSTRCTSAAAGSRCRATSRRRDPAARAPCWRSIPRC